MAVEHDMNIEQMDAVTAFLQGELEETVYMIQPEQFADGTTKVCKLKKALYGLKQAGRAWNQKLDMALLDIGLKRSKGDRCVYYKISKTSKLFVAVYVDDFLIFSTDKNESTMLKNELKNRFQMKDIGDAQNILGFQIARDRKNNVLWLDQEKYMDKILEKFNMSNCNPVSTPVDVNVKLNKDMAPKTDSDIEEMKKVPFQVPLQWAVFYMQPREPDRILRLQ